ncbi:hypothetical protein ACRBEV_10565 [Methylobacterium phyllosphaerae]
MGDRLSGVASTLRAAADDAVATASQWMTDQIRDQPVAVSARASMVVGQGVAGRDPASVLTVFTAPNSATLQAAAICLGTPAVWGQLQGRVAVVDAEDGAVTTYASNQTQLLETEPRTFENTRLILAGWFSTNPNTFVLVLFAAAIILGLSTQAMLRNVGRAEPVGPSDEDEDRETDR